MATTTNYGWTTPDDTSLVKDGAAAIRTLGSSVDTTTKALNPSTTLGDIEYRSSTANTNTRLPIGTTGQVLAVVGGVPAWATTADQTPLTTKGDIFTFTTVDARLGVGANGTVLTADSSEATGLKWAAVASGGGMTLLSTTTLTGASTTISSISGSYKHLLLNLKGVTSTVDGNAINIRFNGDTGANYYHAMIRAIGGTVVGSFDSGDVAAQVIPRVQSASTVGKLGSANIWIMRYTDTDYIDGFVQAQGHDATNGATFHKTIRYDCSAAVTSITLFGDTGNIGGTAYLYGVN